MEKRPVEMPAGERCALHAQKPRLCIFVIAYHAERTLTQVLDRIPRAVFEFLECEVLIVDDASEDRTYQIGKEYRAAQPHLPITVLQNPVNRGYGGNQKVGYDYAIRHKFDIVAMLHGDGQYAPEELPRLLAPLLEARADAVFGSRMMERFGALRGGMPLYKFLGNKVLTSIENALLGTNLSEFHSGYRLYSVRALEALPFHLNSDAFDFDTEIIIQLLNGDYRIVELSIPTFYGEEISRVNGPKYAKDILVAVVENVFHRKGIIYRRRFDVPKTREKSR